MLVSYVAVASEQQLDKKRRYGNDTTRDGEREVRGGARETVDMKFATWEGW